MDRQIRNQKLGYWLSMPMECELWRNSQRQTSNNCCL